MKRLRTTYTAFISGTFGVLMLVPQVAAAQVPGVGTLIDGISAAAFGAIGHAILSLMGLLLGAAGFLLNEAVNITVLGMGEVLAGGGGTGIEAAWTVLRDLANIGFIFVLLFIGVATILRYSDYGYQKLLVYLVIAALLVNFSLFFSRVIIDTANLMALEAVQKIQLEGECDANSEGLVFDCVENGFSGALMKHLNLTTIYSASRADGTSVLFDDETSQTANVFLITAAGSIFILLTTFVFVTAAILLVIRFVVLVFLMILSPLAFAGMVLPATRKRAKSWFQNLFAQAFFAPAFFILIWATLMVLEGMANSGVVGAQGRSFAEALLGEADASGVLIQFAIAIGFIIAALILAKKLANFGSLGLVSIASNKAGGAVFGGFGRLLQNTVGRAASSRLAKQATRDNNDPNNLYNKAAGGGVRGGAARLQLRGLRGIAKSTFDPRNVGSSVGKWSQQKDIEAGKGIKDGFAAVQEKKDKEEVAFADELGNTEAGEELEKIRKLEKKQLEADRETSAKAVRNAKETKEGLEELRAAGKKGTKEYEEQSTRFQTAISEGKQAKQNEALQEARFQAADEAAEAGSLPRQYARRLEESRGGTFDIRSRFPYLTYSSRGENKQYAKSIRENLDKGSEDKKEKKLLDTVKSTVKENTKKDEE